MNKQAKKQKNGKKLTLKAEKNGKNSQKIAKNGSRNGKKQTKTSRTAVPATSPPITAKMERKPTEKPAK